MLSDGAAHLTDTCPFCAQPIDGVELVDSIAAFFSDAYRDYVSSLRDAAESLKASIGTAAIDPIAGSFNTQIAIAGKWIEQHNVDTSELTKCTKDGIDLWRDAAAKLGKVVRASSPLRLMLSKRQRPLKHSHCTRIQLQSFKG